MQPVDCLARQLDRAVDRRKHRQRGQRSGAGRRRDDRQAARLFDRPPVRLSARRRRRQRRKRRRASPRFSRRGSPASPCTSTTCTRLAASSSAGNTRSPSRARLLGINPFDEPNVTESKNNTSRLLDYYKENGSLPQTNPLIVSDTVSLYADERMAQMLFDLCSQHQYQHNTMSGLIAAQLNASQAGDYFALMAYLPATAEVEAKLEEIRRRLRHVTRRAVTLGYGPRFLHSTGQLHKGGANSGHLHPDHLRRSVRHLDPRSALHLQRAQGGAGGRRSRSAARQGTARAPPAYRRRSDRRAAKAARRD